LREGIDPSSAADSILQIYEVESEAKRKFLKSNQISLRKSLHSYSRDHFGYDQYNNDLTSYTTSLILRDKQRSARNLDLSNTFEVDLLEFKSVKLTNSDDQSLLFNKVFDRVILDGKIPSFEGMSLKRGDMAKEVVKTIKAIFIESGEVWDKSDIQMYFDSMRRNIGNFEPFDLNGIQNPVLQSLAAFILKGEDFESLKSYLETNAMPDYRYAFALWGAMIGYVSIPRALIQRSLRFQEIAKLHKEALESLGQDEKGISVTGTTSDKEEPAPNLQISDVPFPIREAQETFKKRTLKIFDSTYCRKPKGAEQLREILVKVLQDLEERNEEDGLLLLTKLEKYPGWDKKPKPWLKLKEGLCKEVKDRSKENRELTLPFEDQIEPEIETGFISTSTKKNNYASSVLEPGNLLTIVRHHFPNLNEKVTDHINWFVGNYSQEFKDENGRVGPGMYASHLRDNASVLAHFDKYIKQKEKHHVNDYKKVPVKEILELLYSIYRVHQDS